MVAKKTKKNINLDGLGLMSEFPLIDAVGKSVSDGNRKKKSTKKRDPKRELYVVQVKFKGSKHKHGE